MKASLFGVGCEYVFGDMTERGRKGKVAVTTNLLEKLSAIWIQDNNNNDSSSASLLKAQNKKQGNMGDF